MVILRDPPAILVAELAAALRAHRARLVAGQHAGLKEGWVFAEEEGGVLRKNYLRIPLLRVLEGVGIKGRFTVHGFRRTFNNIARQVAGDIVTRSITGHVTPAMTEHYSHVGRAEKLAAAGSVVRLVLGRRGGQRGQVGDQVGDRTGLRFDPTRLATSVTPRRSLSVRGGGLEPPLLSKPDPKSGASTSSAILAWNDLEYLRLHGAFVYLPRSGVEASGRQATALRLPARAGLVGSFER